MTEHEKRKTLFRIAFDGLMRTPPKLKAALFFNVFLFSALIVSEVIEWMGEGGSRPPIKLVGLTLLMLGACALTVGSVLYTASQQDASCSLLKMKIQNFRVRTRKLDEVLIALPLFLFVAAAFVATGLGIFLSTATSPWAVGLLGGMGAWFFFWGGAMLVSTTRFLYTEAREQAEAAERARSEAIESQLAALQAQMNPHFLFNTLNTVASLIRTDAEAAEATVENLSVVLRRTLDRSQRVLSTVDDEVDHLAAYLSVAKQRFGERLHVHWAIDPEARDLVLPTMTLQPLVENALKYGIGARLEGGAVHVGAHVERSGAAVAENRAGAGFVAAEGQEVLVLEVADDGPGFPRRYEEGTGLTNLRERLATLYGDDGMLRIEGAVPGSRVVVSVPAVAAAEEVLNAAFKRGATVDDIGDAGATEIESVVGEIAQTARSIARETKREIRDTLGEVAGAVDDAFAAERDRAAHRIRRKAKGPRARRAARARARQQDDE